MRCGSVDEVEDREQVNNGLVESEIESAFIRSGNKVNLSYLSSPFTLPFPSRTSLPVSNSNNRPKSISSVSVNDFLNRLGIFLFKINLILSKFVTSIVSE